MLITIASTKRHIEAESPNCEGQKGFKIPNCRVAQKKISNARVGSALMFGVFSVGNTKTYSCTACKQRLEKGLFPKYR
jgi:hypothetical protein